MSKPGRNELCSCGSGKKFKRCHGLTPDSTRSGRFLMIAVGVGVLAAVAAGVAAFTYRSRSVGAGVGSRARPLPQRQRHAGTVIGTAVVGALRRPRAASCWRPSPRAPRRVGAATRRRAQSGSPAGAVRHARRDPGARRAMGGHVGARRPLWVTERRGRRVLRVNPADGAQTRRARRARGPSERHAGRPARAGPPSATAARGQPTSSSSPSRTTMRRARRSSGAWRCGATPTTRASGRLDLAGRRADRSARPRRSPRRTARRSGPTACCI